MNNNLITIIIPVYNEEKTILTILEKLSEVKKITKDIQVVVVDDGSNDDTKNIIIKNNQLYDLFFSFDKNIGKGGAVKKGLELSQGKYVMFQDADLEYDPIEIVKFFKIIKKFDPDLIIGSRFNYPDYTRSHNIMNKFGNQFLTFLFNILYNTTFTDIYSCYACFKKDKLVIEDLKTTGFEQHAEILCKVVKKGDRFYELPINYNGRGFKEGKKIKFYHIFSVIYQIILGKFLK